MNKPMCTVLTTLAIALGLCAGTAAAQSPPVGIACSNSDDVYSMGYFTNAHTSGAPDAQLRLTNDGASVGNLSANIYVFNNDEEMVECCSCTVTPDGYLDLDVNSDLTGNPLTVPAPHRGIIKVVGSIPGYGNPAEAYTYTGTYQGIRGWMTQVQNGATTGSYSLTQSDLKDSCLSLTELFDALQETCKFVVSLGSGAGVCSCNDAGD